MNIINLTPHIVRLNDGTEFAPSGQVARVSSMHGECRKLDAGTGIPVFVVRFGAVEGLPDPAADTVYIVSGVVASRCPSRSDVFSPATGHRDCHRVDGQVVSVPGLMRAGGVA